MSKQGAEGLTKYQVSAAKQVAKAQKAWDTKCAVYADLEKKRTVALKNIVRSQKLVERASSEYTQTQKASDPEAYKKAAGKMQAALATLRKSREHAAKISQVWLNAHEALSKAEFALFEAIRYANGLKTK